MGFNAFTGEGSGRSALYKNSASLVTEHAFLLTSYFSALGSGLGVGTSGVFDGLSGVSNSNLVIFGWGGTFQEAATAHSHIIFNITDEDDKVLFTAHTSTEQNGTVTLPLPIKVKEGSGIYYRVLDDPTNINDVVHFNIFYTSL